jgi:UDP-GlcNAc:undecaprenyl-phosphate/decaprenyl-phosphate GlcNAc-1-phosphate transferase
VIVSSAVAGGVAGVVSCAVCIALTPLVRSLSLRFGAVDRPGPLKIQSRPIARLGGVAIALSLLAAILAVDPMSAYDRPLFFAALAAIWLIGVADDLRDVPLTARLAAQSLAGVLLWLGGWRFSFFSVLPRTGALSLAVVCFLVIVVVNSFNFLDGSDGVAAGVAAIIGAAYIAISAAAIEPLFSAVSGSLVGACAAFLIFNWPPATIYLGDSGSTLLGYCVVFLSFDSVPSGPPNAAARQLLPLALAGLPLLDAALAVARRLKSRVSPLRGDRRHFYDLLLARQWPPRLVALACYGITIELAFVAWLGVRYAPRHFLIVWIFNLGGLLAAAVPMGALRAEKQESQIRRRVLLARKRKAQNAL